MCASSVGITIVLSKMKTISCIHISIDDAHNEQQKINSWSHFYRLPVKKIQSIFQEIKIHSEQTIFSWLYSLLNLQPKQ